MSVKSEESDTKFREWKKEITKRCEEHLAKHPEYKPLKPPLPKVQPNTVVSVRESIITKGLWSVWVDGHLEQQFEGPMAHYDATKYANRVLNQDGPSRGNEINMPDRCIHCGNRFSHRSDCPNRDERQFN